MGRSLLVLLMMLVSACATAPQAPTPVSESESLVAFARLYGYVRYFHPSDEAALVDWNRLLIHGSGEVRQASTREDLQSRLEALFLPIAPSLRLYPDGTPPPPAAPLPQGVQNPRPVYWQHLGAGLGQVDRLYKSLRSHREPVYVGSGADLVNQSIPAGDYRGHRLRLRAALRTEAPDADGGAQLWLSVVRDEGRPGIKLDMKDRPVRSAEWALQELETVVPDDARTIAFGASFKGGGRAWIDSFELLTAPPGKAEWSAAPILNPGFEEAGQAPGWILHSRVQRYEVDAQTAHSGGRALRIEAPEPPPNPLFAEAPQPGELLQRSLGAGLAMQLPLALYADANGTLPQVAEETLKLHRETLQATQPAVNDPRRNLAAVIATWNLFQHFYPYLDVVPVDWNAQLVVAIDSALHDADTAALHRTLQRLVAASGDCHGNVQWMQLPPQRFAPVLFGWVENQIVVTATAEPERVQVGDVLLSIDGVPAAALLVQHETLIAGSSQWKRHQALRRLAMGDAGSRQRWIVERDALRQEMEMLPQRAAPLLSEARPVPVGELRPGIWYVNLGAVSMTEIAPQLPSLARARGVVFDLRGYPRGDGSLILRHLIREPDTSQWMYLPRYLRPDQQDIAGFQISGWQLQPAEPHIGGRIVFISDSRAVSQAESVLGYIEGQQLGEIVGSPSAGTNGNIRMTDLPGGFRLVFTGMLVRKHDGSQQHLVGVQPTIPLQPTLAGIRAGRDELLEKALDVAAK